MSKFDERKYYETLKFILFKATGDLFPDAHVRIENSLNNGIFGKILNIKIPLEIVIEKIKIRMIEIIKENKKIILVCDNIEILKENSQGIKRKDIKRLLDNTGLISMKEYEMDGYKDYFHDELYNNTKKIYLFDIYNYEDGFILKMPKENNPYELPPIIDNKKLSEIFKENSLWNSILDVACVGCLNEKNINGTIEELIRINEVLHNSKLTRIVKEILNNKNIKIVTIAGPSSSGKTTFSKKLRLHLLSERVIPLIISLDNYYKNRLEIPILENGKKDFESLESLELDLLNSNLNDLLKGKEIYLPVYNFITGEREISKEKIQLNKNGIIVIEGIHGLNEKLLKYIQKTNIYKIYISCLTQLNIDYHNRIYTSDVRKIRRIVRDVLSRNTSAEKTLETWEEVRKGEEKNIFPFQENADIIYDSSLVYELAVLKVFAQKELIKIKPSSVYYKESKRLLKFLDYFLPIETSKIPDDSILKEFIGGSFFYKY